MNSFKVGDKVRVKSGVPGAGDALHDAENHYPWTHNLGKRLFVKECRNSVCRLVIDDKHVDQISANLLEPWVDGATYDAARREWHDPKPQAAPTPATTYPVPYIVVLRNADGSLAPADVPIQHPSLFNAECEARRLADAECEARRLADKHRGKEFCVFSYAGRSARVVLPTKMSIEVGDVVRVNRAGDYACPIRGLALVEGAGSELLWLRADGRVAVCHPFDVTLVAKGVKA